MARDSVWLQAWDAIRIPLSSAKINVTTVLAGETVARLIGGVRVYQVVPIDDEQANIAFQEPVFASVDWTVGSTPPPDPDIGWEGRLWWRMLTWDMSTAWGVPGRTMNQAYTFAYGPPAPDGSFDVHGMRQAPADPPQQGNIWVQYKQTGTNGRDFFFDYWWRVLILLAPGDTFALREQRLTELGAT